MCPRSDTTCRRACAADGLLERAGRVVLGLAIVVCAALAPAAAGDELADYLAAHDLNTLLAVHLQQQLRDAEGERRMELIDQLADLYAQLLESTTDPKLRDALERRGRALLAEAPRDSADVLRLALLRGPYRLAEKIAERHRLRLAEPDELEVARTTLSEIIPRLRNLTSQAEKNAELAQRRLSRASGSASTAAAAEAEQKQQLADQCRFLSAWALYYQSFLHQRRDNAVEAQKLFSELLEPELAVVRPSNVSVDLRAVDSYARSILGMALCKSMTASSVEALQWLTLLEHERTIDALRREVPVWAMTIHLEHSEYAEALNVLQSAMQRREQTPMLWLRLLAVHSAEAPAGHTAARENVRFAVTQLAGRGELEQVLDLARRYGQDLLGRSGFAMHYVSGLIEYYEARDVHGSESAPAGDNAQRLYNQAEQSFRLAIAQPDAAQYESAAAGSRRLIGLCRYFQGRFLDARDAFLQAADELTGEQAADALWMAIASLDQVVQAGDNQELRRELRGLIDTFLNRFPSSQYAPKLLVRQAMVAPAPNPDMVAELLSVPPNSDAYAEARQHAETMLYQLFRRSQGSKRTEYGNEFLNVAVAMLAQRPPITSMTQQHAPAIIVRCRRMLEVALSRNIQRLTAAASAFEALDELREAGINDLADIDRELLFRRVQFNLAHDRIEQAAELADRLWTADAQSTWARLASRAMFRRALELRRTSAMNRRPTTSSLQLIVTYGGRVLREYENQSTQGDDATLLSWYAAVADAAMQLWEITDDPEMGQRALFLYDNRLLEHRPNNVQFLRATAVLSEAFDVHDRALQCWRRLVSGLPKDSEQWFEAKFRLIALLAQRDPQRARAVMDQHKQLNPDYGPQPWGARLRGLDERLPAPDAPKASDDGGEVS